MAIENSIQANPSTANPNSSQMENIKVAVRLRPFTEKEKQRGSQRIVDIEQNTVALYGSRHDSSSKKFTFDYSYWSHDGFKRDSMGVNVPDLEHPNCDKYVGQAKVFDDLGEFLLSNALSGYNSALLAYGQTGSGKSYTVSGYGQNEGILPRFARALFEELDKRASVLNKEALREHTESQNESKNLPAEVNQETSSKSGNLISDESSTTANTKDDASSSPGDESSRNRYEVCFSMIEIYNEVVRDLLAKNLGSLISHSTSSIISNNRRGLKVREHPKRGFFVEGLTSYSCANKDEIELKIEEGHLNKSIAATSMNETSSRGHTIYEFKIKQYRLKSKDNPEETLITSVVQLVDLAGSERMAVHVTGGNGGESFVGSRSNSPYPVMATQMAKSSAGQASSSSSIANRRVGPTSASSTASTVQQTSGSQSTSSAMTLKRNIQAAQQSLHSNQQQRFKESVSINQSLSALGNCIQVLSQYSQQLESNNQAARRQRPKIPYRDSVLTKLLNSCCLSGNSKVVIIATLSPADSNYDDTLSTLRFADRAKQISTHATVNRMLRGQIVDALQRENERLKQMIDGRVTRSDDSSQTSNFDDTENMNENFNGPRINEQLANGGSNVEVMATPTRNRIVKRTTPQEQKKSKRSTTTTTASMSKQQQHQSRQMTASNPSLASPDAKMQRLVSPASRLLNKNDGSGNNRRGNLPKSRSMAYGLANAGDQSEADLLIDDTGNELDDAGLLDERELGDIKEGLLSSDESEEESFGAIEVDGLTDEDKIGLFNKMLSNSKIASKLEQTEGLIKANKIPRPKKGANRVLQIDGIQSVSALSNSLKKTNPYLSNLNPDEQLTGMISYIIKQGETIIGKSELCDIVLHGAELRPKHARVTRINSEENGVAQSVFIEPINESTTTTTTTTGDTKNDQKASVALMVNGAQVLTKTRLNHCDRLLFGSNIYFVFIDNVNSSKSQDTTLANADLVTFDMARNEVLRKFMSEAKNEAVLKEINGYVHRPGTGKQKSRVSDNVGNDDESANNKDSKNDTKFSTSSPIKSQASPKRSSTTIRKRSLKLTRSITIQDSEQQPTSELQLAENTTNYDNDVNDDDDDDGRAQIKENYRDKLMEDTYEFAMPVAEVNAVAKEMGIKVNYGLKILTGEEQLPEQAESYFDSNTSDGFSSSSMGDSDKNGSLDDRVTILKTLDSLDVPPALFVQVHLEEQNIDFYWSKEKFQARRYKILELFGSWDVGGKSGLVEYLIDQLRLPSEYLIDPFVDDPAATLVLIGHAQITLQPISHLSDIDQSYDVLNFNDELMGTIEIQAIPCHSERRSATSGNGRDPRDPYKLFNEEELEKAILVNSQDLLGKKLVFMLKIKSCNNIPEKYTNVFCQYTLNRNKQTIRTNSMREDSIEMENDTPANKVELSFNHSHYICFDKVDQDTLDFLEHGFLTIQVVGQYKLTETLIKPPTVITTIIRSIHKYKYKLDQQSSYNSYNGSVYDNSNTDSAKSRRDQSTSGINNSGASSVVSTSATANLFDQQNEDDEGINGLSQENIIDMILTKRKLDRAENQLHYLKRTINIAEHYNKKHIPVKTVKKLLSSYGHELDGGGLDEIAADVAKKGKSQSNKNSGCSIQ